MDFTRALATDVEVMGRTIVGQALSWNRPYRVSDDGGATWYIEGWRPGSFARGLEETGNVFELRLDHEDVRIGRTQFTENERGLEFSATVDSTPIGDVALEKAKDGRCRTVSIRWSSSRQHPGEDGVLWRTRGVVRELSLIDRIQAQYPDAAVAAVRAADTADLEAAAASARSWREIQARGARLVSIDPYAI